MHNIIGDKLNKLTLVFSVVTMLLISSLGNPNASALDLSQFGLGSNLGQSAECVIVVVGCDGTGSVGSSGSTIIGSNNGNNNTDANGAEPGTLTVTKEVRCDAPSGNPSNEEACAIIETLASFPEPSDYQITVSGNNPNPSNFPGSSTGNPVEISAGEYTITESLPSLTALATEIRENVINILEATGDCIPGPENQNFTEATGIMTPGGSQTCHLINIVQVG